MQTDSSLPQAAKAEQIERSTNDQVSCFKHASMYIQCCFNQALLDRYPLDSQDHHTDQIYYQVQIHMIHKPEKRENSFKTKHNRSHF